MTQNVVTGYSSSHRLDSLGQPQAVSGIEVECEDADVFLNELVDLTGVGLAVLGGYSREESRSITQASSVTRNRVIAAGVHGYAAIAVDALGVCGAPRSGARVPCIDVLAERRFDFSIADNQFWTSPRGSFDIGLDLGMHARWGGHEVYGVGGSVSNNVTTGNGAIVNIGLAVLGLRNVMVVGNGGFFVLEDTKPGVSFHTCPLTSVGAGLVEAESIAPGSQPTQPLEGAAGCVVASPPRDGLERLRLSDDGKGWVGTRSGRPIKFWGVGLAHDTGRPSSEVADYFRDLTRMGVNAVRIRLEIEEFLAPVGEGQGPSVRPDAIERFRETVQIAEELGIYLKVTGLGIERTSGNGSWYDSLTSEAERWEAQRRFWEAIARVGSDSPAIAYYEVMNEPQVPTQAVASGPGAWCNKEIGGECFPQYVTLDPKGRSQTEIANEWLSTIGPGIHAGDGRGTPVGVGTIFCQGALALPETSQHIDLQTVHIYPGTNLDAAITYVRSCAGHGAPLIIGETGPFGGASEETLERFALGTRPDIAGVFWQADWRTPADIGEPTTYRDALRTGVYRVIVSTATRFGSLHK